MERMVVTFEEAVVEYTKATGKAPEFGEMIEIYHRYRKTAKGYGWKNFIEFIDWNK